MSSRRWLDGDKTELELRVASIWSEVLQRKIDDYHAHFNELGGNSLSGLRLVNRLNSELDARLPVEAFLDYPTVAAMADFLGNRPSDRPSLG